MQTTDTIAALATPPGRGGVGMVRVSGPLAAKIAEALIGALPRPRVAHLAAFKDDAGAPIDDGIALYFKGPASFTGEDVLELHAHGSPVVLAALVRRVIALGARHAEPGEFTKRAYLNEKLDLVQAEAVADIIDAATESAARAAVRSLTGEFSKRIQTLQDKLIHLRMFVEATLDFPEEDIDFIEAERARDKLTEASKALAVVLQEAGQGQLLHDGIRVVIAGEPNVGKSSLLNMLAGDDIAIVTAIAGTTRDTIKSRINLRGLPVEIIDTAGLRETNDAVERIGIERTRAAIHGADLAVILVEGNAPVSEAMLAELPKNLPHIIVRNKIDQDLALAPKSEGNTVWLSAMTGAGVDLLKDAIAKAVGFEYRESGGFIARERHTAALKEARSHVEMAAEHLDHAALELFAEELRLAHEALGAITGEFTADDLLGEIFSRFCIGK